MSCSYPGRLSGSPIIGDPPRHATAVRRTEPFEYRQQHRLANPAAADLAIIEVQAGGYPGEDDIVSFDDVYGRT
jgi:hypothetical protein